MPETSPTQQSANPAPAAPAASPRRRPPGETGGHTVMPWEQGEAEPGHAPSHIPAGSDPTTTASGGSSKNVPPPAQGQGMDGLGQGAGTTTVKAKEGMMPPPSQTVTGEAPRPMSGKPPTSSAGALAKHALPETHPEGMEQPTTVPKDDAPSDAVKGADPVAQKATPPASKQAESDAQPVGKPAAPPQARPNPAAADRTAKESAPMVPSTGQDAAKAASGAAVHPTNPAAQTTSGQADKQDDALIQALDQKLAEMLAHALHETVAEAVRQTRVAARPAAPPPVQPTKKAP